MKVSVIVPVYKGKKYLNKIANMINNNCNTIQSNGADISVELVLVNDYPDEEINTRDVNEPLLFELKIHNNIYNQGIHQSRVNGIHESTGDYILMLDQDDEISYDCIYSQIKHIGKNDIVIGNGYRMHGDEKKIIYRNNKKQNLALKEQTYLYAANQIVSPGHCLVRKDSIPEEWIKNIIVCNGGDDMFLWLLMFEKHLSFCINPDIIYTHVDTGNNLSLDLNKMYESSENIIKMLGKCEYINKKTIALYQKRINFLESLQNKKLIQKIGYYFKNIDICIYKVWAYYR